MEKTNVEALIGYIEGLGMPAESLSNLGAAILAISDLSVACGDQLNRMRGIRLALAGVETHIRPDDREADLVAVGVLIQDAEKAADKLYTAASEIECGARRLDRDPPAVPTSAPAPARNGAVRPIRKKILKTA